jgi:hypothetical protein
MSIIQGTSKAAGGAGYEIDQSIRFNAEDSAYLEKTYGSSESTLTAWSFSAWMKRSKLGAEQWLFAAGTASSNLEYLRFTSGDKLEYKLLRSGSLDSNYITSQLFRDPSAWMHIYAYRSSTTFKLYINGSEVTDFSTSNAPGSSDGQFGKNYRHRIGTAYATPSNFLGAYLSEINFVPGTALAATDFGEYNDDGVWVPIEYTNAAGYGTNGFYITGETASDLGEDFSGNNNDFTSSGLATTTDQMLDTPTNNFCTWNPLKTNSSATLSDGNLNYTASGAQRTTSTFAVNSGKWYAEFTISAATGSQTWGVVDIAQVSLTDAYIGQRSYEWGIDGLARTWNNGSNAANYTDFSASDVIGIALDMDNGKVWFRDNDGTFLSGGDPAAGTTPDFSGLSGDICFAAQFTGGNVTINCGQSAYTNAPPTGFNALSTANLPTPSITDGSAHFNSVLFTGNSGTAFSVTGVGFQPDFVWGKPRSYADNHRLMDVVRGSTKQLISNSTGAEFTQAQGITSFDSDGFTVGTHNGLNTGTNTYVAWNWLADNTTGSSNTDGSITSTVSANTTSGFSISTYTGNATVGATVGHGLGIAPKVVIVKSRSNAESWVFGHDSVGWTKAMYMQTTGTPYTLDIYWNNTAPTSSVVELHDHPVTNGSGYTYVMYSFAEIPGYSSIGVYTGNGSTDGPMIYTNGMKPAFVLIKRTNATGGWFTYDSKRDPENALTKVLQPDSSAAEVDSIDRLDFLSNGFKLRTSTANNNASGGTFIYMAFAENPFGGDGVAPATAR